MMTLAGRGLSVHRAEYGRLESRSRWWAARFARGIGCQAAKPCREANQDSLELWVITHSYVPSLYLLVTCSSGNRESKRPDMSTGV